MPHCSDLIVLAARSSFLMRSLRRLFSRFGGSTNETDPKFGEPPARTEVLSRFIFSERHFSRSNHRVKSGAFLPWPSMETSVYRTIGLEKTAIQAVGNAVGEESGRKLKAWGDVQTGIVLDVGLRVCPDNKPVRHATITGWPMEKEEQ